MKKITISLVLLFFAFRVVGQMSPVSYTGTKPVPAGKYLTSLAPKNGGSNFGTRSSMGSAWLNYSDVLDEVIGGLTGYIAPIFTDSSAYFSYGPSTWGKATAYSIGQTFNAYSEFFVNSGGIDTISLVPSEGYTLDSISVVLAYTRLDPDTSIVDTLVVNLYQGANKSNAFPNAYFTATPDTYYLNHFGYDTVFFPLMYYNYQTFGPLESYYTKSNVNAPATTIKILLHQSDTAAAKEGFITAVPGGGMQVAAGNLVGCTVAFKPGYKWNFGDTISLHYNTAEFLSFDENNSTGEPYYTPGDNNISYLIPQVVQYNQSIKGWDSLYIPALAYLPGFQLQDHDISYHITYTPQVITPPISILPQSPTLCSGESVTLTVPSSGSNYTWSPSTGLSATTGDTVIADPTITTEYTVNGIDSLGESATGTDVVYVQSPPITPVVTVNYDTLTSSSLSNNQWIHDTVITGATNQTYIANSSGWYQVEVTDPNYGCIAASNTVYIGATGIVVWPGDANDDLVVNNYDLIPIGLYYGETGTARDTTTITWAPHPSANWNVLQSNGKDMKYVDCNGDGVINSNDTLAVTQNYGLTHPFDSPRQSIERSSGTVPLSIVADSSSYHAGSIVHASVLLGSSGNPATNIYGLAYNITFDASNIVPGTLAFNYNNASFMGAKNTNTLVLTQLNNDVETAVTGIDHTNKTGYGKIGDLYFTLAANSNAQLGLSISSYEAVDAGGNEKGLSPVDDTVTVTTGINQLAGINNQLSVYPNPVSNNVFIRINSSVNDLQDWTMQISDELGRVVYKTSSLNYLNEIDMSKLPCAMYFISVISQTGSAVYPVIRQE